MLSPPTRVLQQWDRATNKLACSRSLADFADREHSREVASVLDLTVTSRE